MLTFWSKLEGNCCPTLSKVISANVAFNKSRLKRKISELTLTYADIFFQRFFCCTSFEIWCFAFVWKNTSLVCLRLVWWTLKLSPCYMGKARCLLGHESHINLLRDESYLLSTCTLTWSFCSFIKINTESHLFLYLKFLSHTLYHSCIYTS